MARETIVLRGSRVQANSGVQAIGWAIAALNRLGALELERALQTVAAYFGYKLLKLEKPVHGAILPESK